jgi:hypothetical protein
MSRTTPAPGKREHWSAYDLDTLHRILVEDAVASHATDLPWMIGALGRIAKETKRPVEEVFLDIAGEVAGMGLPMPMHSGVIR